MKSDIPTEVYILLSFSKNKVFGTKVHEAKRFQREGKAIAYYIFYVRSTMCSCLA